MRDDVIAEARQRGAARRRTRQCQRGGSAFHGHHEVMPIVDFGVETAKRREMNHEPPFRPYAELMRLANRSDPDLTEALSALTHDDELAASSCARYTPSEGELSRIERLNATGRNLVAAYRDRQRRLAAIRAGLLG